MPGKYKIKLMKTEQQPLFAGILGGNLLKFNGNNKSTRQKKRLISANGFLLVIGLVLAAVSIFIWMTNEASELSKIYIYTESRARSYANETEIRYNNIYDALVRLTSKGAPSFETTGDAWEKDAGLYIDPVFGIKSIAWVDRNFRIRRIVPLDYNGSPINKSVDEVLKNPFDLNLWIPCYKGLEFTGYILGTVDLSQLNFAVMRETNTDYMLSLANEGRTVFISENWKQPVEELTIQKFITLKNATVLDLSIAPTKAFIHSAMKNAKNAFYLSLFLSFITLVVIYYAQNFRVLALASGSRYRNLFAASGDAIFVINLKGECQEANPAAASLVGYSAKELHRMHISDLWPQNGTPLSEGQLHFWEEGGTKEMHIRHKDGHEIPVDVMFSLAGAGTGQKVILGIARDITLRKRAEDEREELRAQVIQSQKLESIGTLAGGVAHEINNPINGILNYAQLIRDEVDVGTKHHEFASEIIFETERVANIVRNLLTFARQDKQAHSPARIADIVKGATTLIQTIIRGDMIELEVDVPGDLPQLKCRTQQIQQVIMNLLTNARDALNKRYKEYDENKIVRISSRTFETEGRMWIRTTVEDHGSGITEEVRKRIFDPFYTTKERAEGTGLGLSISNGIVKDHHGKLTVESIVNEYTRFHLDLPVDNGWELDE